MLRSHLLSAWRSLQRHPGTTALNVLALGTGLAVSLFVLLFIADQKRQDTAHTATDRTYRLLTDRTDDDGTVSFAATPAPLAPALRAKVPGVERATRIGEASTNAVVDGAALPLRSLYAEASFFDVFDGFTLAAGSPADALDGPGAVVLTREAAVRFFGTAGGDVVGRTVTLEGLGAATVTGVLAAEAPRTHLHFDALVAWATQGAREAQAEWRNLWTYATYVRLAEGAAPEAAAQAINAATADARTGLGADGSQTLAFRLQPLDGIALGPVISNQVGTQPVPGLVAYFLLALAGVVLLTVGFNYTGLAVAQALRRAAEVGVRKTLGARRREVVAQFLVEALLLAGLALGVALVLVPLLAGAFNQTFVAQELDALLRFDTTNVLVALGLGALVTLVVGLLAGLYPAAFLSSFQPVTVLHGAKGPSSPAGRLRAGIMFGQVALAVVFAVTAALLYGQFRHMAEADFGFATDHVLAVETQGVGYATLRDGMRGHSGVTAVGGIDPLPAMGSYYWWQIQRPGAAADAEPLRVLSHAVTPQTPDVLGLERLAGRPLTEADVQAAADTSRRTGAVLVTRLLAERLGYDTPEAAVGQRFEDGSTTYAIAGVVEDFRTTQSGEPLQPIVLYPDAERATYVLARVQPGAAEAVRDHAEAVWATTGSIHALDAAMLDARFAERPSTRVMGHLAVIVAGVAGFAVLLACLGLLGMAAYRAETRVREVGIRKALGATAAQIVLLLTRHTLALVAAALVVALPAAWLLNGLWLDVFVYRIDPGAGLFAACALTVVLLAAAAVAVPTLRAARTDPAAVLRAE